MRSLPFACAFLVLSTPAFAADSAAADVLRSCPTQSAPRQGYQAVWAGNSLVLNDVTRGMAFRGLLSLAQAGVFDTPEIYVTFDRRSADALLPDSIRAAYPKEITIVLQYEFADLIVGPTSFDVTLWFGGKPARLHVPFAAVTLFLDERMSFCYAAVPSEVGAPIPSR